MEREAGTEKGYQGQLNVRKRSKHALKQSKHHPWYLGTLNIREVVLPREPQERAIVKAANERAITL